MFEEIKNDGQLMAFIVYNSYNKDGISFFTESHLSQQLAYMNHKKGKIIQPHIHNIVSRTVEYTQEVLFVKKGKLRVDFYDESRKYLCSRTLTNGDVILLINAGHGFEVLEDLEMYEVKQGPYVGESDKTRFEYDEKVVKANHDTSK